VAGSQIGRDYNFETQAFTKAGLVKDAADTRMHWWSAFPMPGTILKQQWRKAGVTALGIIGNLLLVLLRNKLLALALGPAGIGWMALINSLIETAAIASASGSSDALNRELARKNAGFSDCDIVSTCAGLLAILLMLAMPAITAAYLGIVPQRIGLGIGVAGLCTALIAAVIWRFFTGIFLGFGLARLLAKAMVAGALANLLLTAVLLWQGLREPLVFVVLSPLMMALSGALAIGARTARLIDWQRMRKLPALRPVILIALPVTLGLLLEPMITLYLRSETAARFGEAGVGLIQPGIQLAMLAGIVFNAVAAMTIVRWDQLEERSWSKNYMLLLAVSLTLPIAGTAAAFAAAPLYPPIITLLFSEAFVSGAQTVAWFLIGESFRIAGALLLFTFMSRALGLYTLIPRVGALATAVLSIETSERIDLFVVAQSYTAAFACYFALSLILWLGLQAKISKPSPAL
jgi:O-antigen/teichoic acid export membrane protein